jgi:hypothetical protein
MLKAMYEELKLAVGSISSLFTLISFIAGLSIAKVSIALFCAAVAFPVALAVVVPVALFIAARRDPEMTLSMVVKPSINGFFLPLVAAAFLANLGYKDPSKFGLVQVIGAALLALSIAGLALAYADYWKARHKQCSACRKWNVVQAIRCARCQREEFTS